MLPTTLQAAGRRLHRAHGKQRGRQMTSGYACIVQLVSEEVDDIVKSGMFRPTVGSLEGKWLTTTPELAAQWGKRLWIMSKSLGHSPKPFTIIEGQYPSGCVVLKAPTTTE